MSVTKATTITQKCQNCGGNLIFSPTQQTLVCQQCGMIVPISGTPSTEKSFQMLLINAPTWQKGTAVYQCEHCGAKSVVSKSDLVAKCEYCGAANMLKTREIPGARPDTIIAFRLNQVAAEQAVQTWLSKRFFVPSRFKHQLATRPINGVYYPAFTFDARTTTKYTGVVVRTETKTTVVDGKMVTQSQTVHHPIAGTDTHIFDDVLIMANDEITPKIVRALQPFDTNRGKVFQQSYLAGFTVCQASKEPIPCWEEAKKTMHSVIYNKITTKYGIDTLGNLQLDMGIVDVTYKYVLLPIYVGHTTYQDKRYPIYINGQTGKVYGKTPKSPWKVLAWLAGMGLLAVGVGILLAVFL
ncbi:MAG: hypothetical protein NC133_02315 [Prevotella sp.]|nr:hypothetical protein [Prevotella sp.]